MARPSTVPTFPTIAAAQRALMGLEPVAMRPRSSKSGGEWHDLTDRMHRADPRCLLCDLPTLRTQWRGAMTAELGLLVPCSALDSHCGQLRLGYVPGNVALMCSACIDARATYAASVERVVIIATTPAPVRNTRISDRPAQVIGANVDASRVMLAWPQLRKATAPVAPSRDEAIALMRVAPAHKSAARAARAAKGLPF